MEQLSQLIAAVVQELYGEHTTVVLTRPDEQFGDYATNVALQLSKKVGKNPREIAAEIVAKLIDDSIVKTEVAGPGFINITLTDSALIDLTYAETSKSLMGKEILVEYSDPNPFKPLHAGHLYTTLVGDTIARLIENAGAITHRINYGGDVGRHVGISMWSILQYLGGENPDKLQEITDKPKWLGERYVAGTTAFEEDEIAKKEILEVNRRVYELHEKQDHESNFAKIYWTCREWSYAYFAELYLQLHVTPFERYIPESEVTPLALRTVREQLQKGVFSVSDGAVIFEGEKYGLHTRVFINSQGLPTYETKDVGLSLTKWRDYHFDRSIIITANEQEQYMRVVIKSIEQFEPEAAKRTTHITHGFVKLMGGVKMSSRKGNTVTALEILDSARVAGAKSDAKPNEDTILSAVKYAFAKNRIGGDIEYNSRESIALEGNSGPYLQYAHARARSILRKSKVESEKSKAFDFKLLTLDSSERSLVRKLGMYAETVDLATAELMPHHICTYLYELAQTFNRFYEHNKVLDNPREAIRLQLVSQYAVTLSSGLGLLGINAPEQM